MEEIGPWNKKVILSGQEFLQSYEWGEFQKNLGKRVKRVQTESFLAQIIFNPLPLGLNYGYVPRGPVVFGDPKEGFFWDSIESTKNNKTIFFEIELSSHLDFIKPVGKKTRQPLKTSILNISKSEEDIFSFFHKTLRYNIRLSQRRKVEIKKESSWEKFYLLQKKTASYQNFKIWPREYYQKLWDTLSAKGMVEIWSAYKENNLLASNFYILFGQRVTYLFGASDYEYRSQMGPHLLHWRAIKEFKSRGFNQYDFWGTDKNNWPGLTLFKERFGGEDYIYPGFYRKPEKKIWFALYNAIKR